MNRTAYLNDPDVAGFAQWLAERLDRPGSLPHAYVNRRNGILWQCDSIWDAFEQYSWPFRVTFPDGRTKAESTFGASTRVLAKLRTDLRRAVSTGDADGTVQASCLVFKWGGVANGNVDWAEGDPLGLVEALRHDMGLLAPDTARLGQMSVKRMNSGLTKVHSLLLDDYVIYDGRVGAALGHLIAQYCVENGVAAVPANLAFPWGAAKEAQNMVNPKNRDPSRGALRFATLAPASAHARWNVAASWLLAEVLRLSPTSQFRTQPEPLRSLEAALFMIGYDLGRFAGAEDAGEAVPAAGFAGAGCTTRGGANAKTFSFEVSLDALESRNDANRMDRFTLVETEALLRKLFGDFRQGWFPLANNVTKMHAGDEKDGLGKFIYDATGKVTHAQAASYLGPILEALGVTEWNGKRRGICWRLLRETEEDVLAQFRDAIGAL